jgi:exosome complex RNA-binding protein Rrp42 (RNase PH superfamily)
LFSGSCSDDCASLLKDPSAVGTDTSLFQSSLHEPENKEVPVSTAVGTLSKLEQSSLHEPENKEVSVPTAAGTLGKLGQLSLPDPENKEVSVRDRHLFVFWNMQ